MIYKFKKIFLLSIITIISLLPFYILIFYSISNKYQLTSKSFNNLKYLNNEFSKLSKFDKSIYSDRANLISEINNIIEPNILEQYKRYLIDSITKIRYSIKLDLIKKDFLNNQIYNQLKQLTNRTYFDEDSLKNDMAGIIKPRKYISYIFYMMQNSKTFYKCKSSKDIVIPTNILSKLIELKNFSYEEYELKKEIEKVIGSENSEKFSFLILSVKDQDPPLRKNLTMIILSVFLICVILLIYIEMIILKKRRLKTSSEIDDNINKAKHEISENPTKILPIWDLANYTLQQYYNKNLQQLNSIYYLSIVVMSLGFILIISILILSIFFKVELKEIGIIAGIITEFIGATFLFIYKSTINQALSYSTSLNEINKTGMSVKIIETIEVNESNKEKIEDAKIEISKSIISKSDN